jgi:branched-chain amino acid transport system permease protein
VDFTFADLCNAIIAGISVGAIYAIVGIGYTVISSATGVFNLAQGDLVMVGVMSSYYGLNVLGLPQYVDAPLVIGFVVLLALFEERTVVRTFLQKTGTASFGWFIATLGFSLVVETVVALLFGRHAIEPIASPFHLGGIHIGNVLIGYRQLFLVVTFVVVILLVEQFYDRTWMGQAMRATAQDRDAASLMGINPITTSRVAFALGGLVAGVAGYVIGPITFSDPTVGLSYTLKGFLALAIGGFDSIRGAVVGGLLLGIGEQVWTLAWGGSFSPVTGLAILVVVLAFRPQGLFSATSTRTV